MTDPVDIDFNHESRRIEEAEYEEERLLHESYDAALEEPIEYRQAIMETNIDQGLEGIDVAKLAGIQECGNCRKWKTKQCDDKKQGFKTDMNAMSWCRGWRGGEK